jgi:hypothetical protein
MNVINVRNNGRDGKKDFYPVFEEVTKTKENSFRLDDKPASTTMTRQLKRLPSSFCFYEVTCHTANGLMEL